MIDLRRVAIIFVIAILYAIFVNAIIGAFYLTPRYEDYCRQRYYPEKAYPAPIDRVECPGLSDDEKVKVDNCFDQKGYPEYITDSKGCAAKFKECNFCQRDFDNASQKYNFYFFIISSILALVAIAIGLLLPPSNDLNEWIATGFMLGGLVTLFFGTFRYYQYLGRYVKPLVIFAELVIVIYLAYRKLKDVKGRKKRR